MRAWQIVSHGLLNRNPRILRDSRHDDGEDEDNDDGSGFGGGSGGNGRMAVSI